MFKMGPNHRTNHRIQQILWSKLTKYSEFGLEIVGFSDLFVTIQRSSKQISQKSCITDICQGPKTPLSLQTHHVYSTLKRCGNDRFHVVSMWNTHGVCRAGKSNMLLFESTQMKDLNHLSFTLIFGYPGLFPFQVFLLFFAEVRITKRANFQYQPVAINVFLIKAIFLIIIFHFT